MSSAVAPVAGTPRVEADRITLTLPDPGQRFVKVRLYQEITRPRDGQHAQYVDGAWVLSVPRPDHASPRALRMEYAFIVDHHDGGQEFLTDPANPLRAPGAFGSKSVVELPGYHPPEWLSVTEPGDDTSRLSWTELPLPRFGASMTCGIWQPEGVAPDEPLPLLIIHDGPEFRDYASVTTLLDQAVRGGRIPPHRAALLAPVPGRRGETYSSSAHYADALAFTALPWLAHTAPQPQGSLPTLMGASLGGLAALHAAYRHPQSVGRLLLQSGSFFRLRTDKHERGFAHFDRISRFVGQVLRTTSTTRPRRIAMTCGTVEENLANNQRMARALAGAGHDVTFATHPDGHNYTSWRDVLDPHLINLLSH